jgi:hypothetical protein
MQDRPCKIQIHPNQKESFVGEPKEGIFDWTGVQKDAINVHKKL